MYQVVYGTDLSMEYLYHATSSSDFENYFLIKSDPSAIKWSGFNAPPDKEKLRAVFETMITNPDIYLYYLLATSHDELMGYAQLNRESDTIVLYAGYSLMPKYQGHGHARKITNLILEKSKELKFEKVQGWISEKNYASLRWNGSFGMIDTGERRVVHMDAFDRDDTFHLYSKDI